MHRVDRIDMAALRTAMAGKTFLGLNALGTTGQVKTVRDSLVAQGLSSTDAIKLMAMVGGYSVDWTNPTAPLFKAL